MQLKFVWRIPKNTLPMLVSVRLMIIWDFVEDVPILGYIEAFYESTVLLTWIDYVPTRPLYWF